MFDKHEFDIEVRSFFIYFNRRINEEIIRFWFNKLKYGDIFSIRKGFDSFKYTNKFPDLTDVINKCRDVQSDHNSSRYSIKKKIECAYCEDVGFIIYDKKERMGSEDHLYSYVARCRCSKGQRQDRSILDITDIYPDYYKNKEAVPA